MLYRQAQKKGREQHAGFGSGVWGLAKRDDLLCSHPGISSLILSKDGPMLLDGQRSPEKRSELRRHKQNYNWRSKFDTHQRHRKERHSKTYWNDKLVLDRRVRSCGSITSVQENKQSHSRKTWRIFSLARKGYSRFLSLI